MKSGCLSEYLEWELSPRKGRRGREEVGMLIGTEDGLFKRFRRFSGEEDWLLGGSLTLEG